MRNPRRKSATSSPAFSRKPPTKRRRTDPARLNLTRRLPCFSKPPRAFDFPKPAKRNPRRKSATSSPAFSRKPPAKRRRTDPARLIARGGLPAFSKPPRAFDFPKPAMRNPRRKSATSSPAFSRKPPTKRRRTDRVWQMPLPVYGRGILFDSDFTGGSRAIGTPLQRKSSG